MDDDDDDEGGLNFIIGEIFFYCFVVVMVGILWGLIICWLVWFILVCKKFKEGLSMLYL